MHTDEIFSKSPAPQTRLNMSAVDVWSSERLLLSYMLLPQPWLLCFSLSQAISTAMIVMCFCVTVHFYCHDCYTFLWHRPFLQPWLLYVSLSQSISTAMFVMCFFVTCYFYSHDCYVFHCYRPFLQPWLLRASLSQAISTAMIVICFFVTGHFYSHDCYMFLCRRPFLQPWLLYVSLSQAISTAMIVICFFVTGHFYSHDCYVFHCYRPFLQPWLLCVSLPLLGSSWCARRCEWGRWNRTRAVGGWLPVYCILLARQGSIKYGLAQLHFQVWKQFLFFRCSLRSLIAFTSPFTSMTK